MKGLFKIIRVARTVMGPALDLIHERKNQGLHRIEEMDRVEGKIELLSECVENPAYKMYDYPLFAEADETFCKSLYNIGTAHSQIYLKCYNHCFSTMPLGTALYYGQII